jgi:UDP-2,3-diacylglucosamine pyrophosphatase LpxH
MSRVGSLYAASIEPPLQAMLDATPAAPLSGRDRLVILSDLHMGDGGPQDDFRHNGDLVLAVLRGHYLAGGYSLVLNGDVEELQRFRLADVHARWQKHLSLFREFERRTALYKIVGNHDETLWTLHRRAAGFPLLRALRFTHKEDTLFLFHGHQATIFFEKYNDLSGFVLRYVANALRIPNTPVAYDSRRRYLTEHRAHAFSRDRRIVSLIGHTHRPLFESMSKIDTLRYRMEGLCHDYPVAGARQRRRIERTVAQCKAELERLWDRDRRDGMRAGLYGDELSIPCLFNSGCCIGKRGITALEIAGGEISLVHWFDKTVATRHMEEEGRPADRLDGTPYYRAVMKQDRLEYVFSRIRLLA